MDLEKEAIEYLKNLLDNSQNSFEGLSCRWNDLQPRREFDVKLSEDFPLGFVFGKMEESFVGWFYSKYGRSMTDSEYKQFWLMCRKLATTLNEKYGVFHFRE